MSRHQFSVQFGAFLYLMAAMPAPSYPLDTHRDLCRELQCQHDSACRTVTTNQTSHAECACQGNWFGTRCQAHIFLSASHVSAEYVDFQVSFVALANESSPSTADTVDISDFVFTLQFWEYNKTDKIFRCNIISEITKRSFTVSGLKPRTRHVFCAKRARTDLCYAMDDVSVKKHNESCLFVQTTRLIDEDQASQHIVLPLTLAAVVVLVLVFVSILLLKKRYVDNVLRCSKQNNKNRRRNRRTRADSCDTNQELFLLSGTPPTPRLNIVAPSSPGKPKHMLSKRAHGYASFSAKNEQTIALTTVIEYSPTGEEGGAVGGREEGATAGRGGGEEKESDGFQSEEIELTTFKHPAPMPS